MLSSLRYRNFRLFFIGQFVSLCGSWMQQTAQAWLIYRLTQDPFMLGLAALAGQFPVFVLGFYAGTRVDRLDRLKLVRWTQAAAMVQAALLAALAYSGRVQVWHVFALSIALGAINAFDIPARQVLISELVEPAVRHNAIALNSTIVNASRVLGPAVAGVLIGSVGEAGCFAINAASFVAVLLALFLIRREAPRPPAGVERSAWEEVGDGLAYALGCEPIRRTIALLMCFSIFGMSAYVLLPVFADALLGAGARGLGILSSSSGVGATVGALVLANRPSSRGLGRRIAAATALYGCALAGLAFSHSLALSSAMFLVAGAALITVLAGTNTLLQELCEPRYLGRIMGFYAMVFAGLAPIGSFFVGGLASRLGARPTVLGLACVMVGLGARHLRRRPTGVGPRAQSKVGPSAVLGGADGPDGGALPPL